MRDMTRRNDQLKEQVVRKVKEAQDAIMNSMPSQLDRNQETYNSEDQDDPKQTFYVTVPAQDNKLIQIMSNPLKYNVIESNKFSFHECRTVYIAPDLYAF